MDQQGKASRFFVARDGADRRTSAQVEPPYLTEEGIVMVDRRENSDRRTQRAADAVNKLAYLVPSAAG